MYKNTGHINNAVLSKNAWRSLNDKLSFVSFNGKESVSMRYNSLINIKVFSMKRISVNALLCLVASFFWAANASAGISWGGMPGANASVNSGTELGTISANSNNNWWGGSWVDMRATGGCVFDSLTGPQAKDWDNNTGNGFDTSASGTAKVFRKSGSLPLETCTVTIQTNDDGLQSRTYYLNQTVTVVNPGSRDDVDPDYIVYANAKTTDGLVSTLNTTNKFAFSISSTPSGVCTIKSPDVNSVYIHHEPGKSGTCTLTANAAGDSVVVPAAASATWSVQNTQYPQLALVSPLTSGQKPSFVFSSTQSSKLGTYIEVGGDCAPKLTNQAALLGNNSFTLKQLSVGTTYTNCFITVTNDVGTGTLNLPPFTVTTSNDGPGGVGGTDGVSALTLWLNGDNLPDSGGISAWKDQSGRKNNFSVSGGGDGTAGNPFTSLQNARDAVTVPDYYYFNIGGNSFISYVDKDGYVLAVSGSSTTNETIYTTASGATVMTLQSDRALATAAFNAMSDISQVRVNATGVFNATTTNATIIAAVKAGNRIPNNNDIGSTTAWVGDTAYFNTTCTSSVAALASKVYHACGNDNGLHWFADGGNNYEKPKWIGGNGPKASMNVWVRANPSTATQPTIGAVNGFKVPQFNGSQYLRSATNVNLNPRSAIVSYSDGNTGAATYSSPLASSVKYGLVGAASNANINSTSGLYTTDAAINGAGSLTYYNNNLLAVGDTRAKPTSYEIISRIFSANINQAETWTVGGNPAPVIASGTGVIGGIEEVMVYNTALNNTQRTIVENYLYTKFYSNYAKYPNLASPVYTYGPAGTYRYDMAGIGRTSASDMHTQSEGGFIKFSNPAGLDNGEYLMWAHDNGALQFNNSDVPALISQRLNRVWRVKNTGLTGADLSFRVSQIPGFLSMCFDPNNLRLLVDSNGVFKTVDNAPITGVYDSKTGMITYTNVPINDGSYISFAVGGVAETIYITPKGAGAKTGKTWSSACTLQSALESPRIIGDELRLSQGVYKPSSTLYIKQGLVIKGGFEGYIESEVSDPATYITILSGDIDSNDEALGNVIMYHRDIRGSNLNRLFNIYNVPDAVTLEGFYITGMSQFSNHGAAVWQNKSTVTYNKMKFFGNRAREMGGALLVYNGTANITESIFLGNVGEEGGAINANVSSTLNITNSQFINNETMILNNRSNGSTPLAVGKALQFNGSANNSVTAASAIGVTNTFTVEAWVKSDDEIHEIDPEDYTGTGGVFSQRYVFWPSQSGTQAGAGLSVGTNGVSVYEHGDGYMPAVLVYSGSGVIGTGWNHIALVYNAGAPTLYVNGVSVRSRAKSTRPGQTIVNAPVTVGGAGYGGFRGAIDEVRIWNDVRTPAEIQDNMYREIENPGSDASLVVYYKFDEEKSPGVVEDFATNAASQDGNMSSPAPLFVNGNVPSTTGSGVGADWNRFGGGAIDANNGSILNIKTSSFIGNKAQDYDYTKAIQGIGGAISLTQNAANNELKNLTRLSIEDSSFSSNMARDGGGAIYAMPGFTQIDVKRTDFTVNSAMRPATSEHWGSGGAIYALGASNAANGKINIEDTEFSQNTATQLGGAIFLGGSVTPSTPTSGISDSNLVVGIKRSAFVSNSAMYGGAYWSWNFSASYAAVQPTKNITTIENTTFTDNTSANHSGAIAAAWGARLALNHDTIYNNTAGALGGGISLFPPVDLKMSNTMIFGNQTAVADASGRNIYMYSQAPSSDGAGNVVAPVTGISGYNMIGYAGDGGSGWYDKKTGLGVAATTIANSFTATSTLVDQIINAVLDTNGGITPNFSLSSNGGAGSAAFNRVPIANCLAQDQRGQARQAIGGFTKCDIGAFETSKIDTDGDAVIDAIDNCPNISNPGAPQANIDGDNYGDICDSDRDGDGVPNEKDAFPDISLMKTPLTSGDTRLDTDGDGRPNVCDANCQTAGMAADLDDDDDTFNDTVDNCPLVANVDQNNIDNDAFGDKCDNDMDGDGLTNNNDNCPANSNPLQEDSDGFGPGDACNAFFVKTVASGLGDGSSWANAFGAGTGTGLQAALDAASAKSAQLIYLRKGIYRPQSTVLIYSGQMIYGGFAGVAAEQYHYQAKPYNNITVITADTNNDDIQDANGITQASGDQQGTNLARIFNLVGTGVSATKSISISGITLTGASSGSAIHMKSARIKLKDMSFIGNKGVNGGGLYMEENAFAAISNSKFSANQATTSGGALHVQGIDAGLNSEISISNTEFSFNVSGGNGGAVSLVDNVKGIVDRSTFNDNDSAISGGAIYANSFTTLSIVKTSFSGNSASPASGSDTNKGGGALYVAGKYTSLEVGSAEFMDNISTNEGGAILLLNSADITQPKIVTIQDTLFKANKTSGGSEDAGGAISINLNVGDTAIGVSRCLFTENTSKKGGAIRTSGIKNLLAVDNSTFFANSSKTGGYGGAIGIIAGTASFTHATVLQNSAASGSGNGGGIRLETSGSLTLKNSLILGNTGLGAEGPNVGTSGSLNYTDAGYNLIGYGASSGLKTGGTANKNPSTVNATSKIAAADAIDKIVTPVLSNYSGAHLSIPLTSTSVARDAIPAGASGCPIVSNTVSAIYDERNFERPDMVDSTDPDQNGQLGTRKCDIGAFEFNNAYRLDCYAEDGLRPDSGITGYYYCPSGTKPVLPELVNNLYAGSADYELLLLLGLLAGLTVYPRRNRHHINQ